MAKRKKALSATQKAYQKEYNRIKRFIKRAEQRGYQFDISKILPKKLTAPRKSSVEKLNRLTAQELYKKSVYGGEATYGEIVTGEQGRRAERQRAAQKAAETRRQRTRADYYPDTTFSVPDRVNEDTAFFDIATIGEFKRLISQYPKKAYPILNGWVDNLIEEHGQHKVAIMLNDGLSSGLTITHKIAYDETAIYEFMADMLDYLDADTSMQADLMDALESDESYNPFL